MNKFIVLILILALVGNTAVFANDKDKGSNILTTEEITYLNGFGVDVDEIVIIAKYGKIIDINYPISREVLKSMRTEGELDVIFVSKDEYNSKLDPGSEKIVAYGSVPGGNNLTHYQRTRAGQHFTETDNPSGGFANWLDAPVSVALGFMSPWAWVPYTVLGVTPSDYLTINIPGDYVQRNTKTTYLDSYYGCYSEPLGITKDFLRTSEQTTTVYVDAYMTAKTGGSYRKSGVTVKKGKTNHYYDGAWIEYMCRNLADQGYLGVYFDN